MYISLNSKKADEYLANLANQIKKEIQDSLDYDEIFEYLELFGELVYKAPNEIIQITSHILEQKSNPPTIHKSPFGEFEGKSHKDLVLKCIELLDHIRYIAPNDVLKLIAQLSQSEDQNIKSKTLEVVKKFSQYDYNVLTKSKLGYGVQRKALDFVLALNREKQLQLIEFVEIVLRELLNPSFEGTTSGLNDKAQYTITMHSGVVPPTDFLKKMRREAIDLAYELYKATDDAKLKLKLIGVFDEASRTPGNVLYGDDVVQMIVDDLKYIAGTYRKIVFGEKGNQMTDLLGVVATIEERLYWINKSEKRRVEESEKLRCDILNDEIYHLFRLFVGDPVTYKEQEGWDTAEKTRGEEIDQIINLIDTAKIEKWFEKLNKIASQHIIVEEWKFNPFKGFIRKLSETKPKVADDILKRAFEENSILKHFTGSFLDGFRIGSHFEHWDKFTQKIMGVKDSFLVSGIIFSLNLPADADLQKLIRESDIDLLEKIANHEDEFSFLKETDDHVLLYALFNTAARNFKIFPKKLEPIIVTEIKKYPKYLSMFFSELSMIFHRKWIETKDLQTETVELLKEKIIELSDVDWHVQGLLLEIGEQYGLKPVMEVLMERIRKDEKKKEKSDRYILDDRYEVIPYHFNPDLSKFIVEHPDYIKIAGEWISEMTTDWSTYNWHVSHLFQRLGKGFDEILASLIEKGDDDSLLKAARAMHSIEGTNFNLCIEIVCRTDNKKILSQVDSNMYTTGVVSGEYGLAEAYEAKAKTLEKYKNDKSTRVKKFAERMMSSFLDSAKRERQRADEEKQLRKIEFEG